MDGHRSLLNRSSESSAEPAVLRTHTHAHSRYLSGFLALFDDVDLSLTQGDPVVDFGQVLAVLLDAVADAREDVVGDARQMVESRSHAEDQLLR